MNVTIDGKKVLTEKDFHRIMAKVFDMEQYYGNNLHALWDMLEGRGDLKITWINADISRKNIDTFDDIIRIFEKAKKRDEELEWKKDKFTYEVIP